MLRFLQDSEMSFFVGLYGWQIYHTGVFVTFAILLWEQNLWEKPPPHICFLYLGWRDLEATTLFEGGLPSQLLLSSCMVPLPSVWIWVGSFCKSHNSWCASWIGVLGASAQVSAVSNCFLSIPVFFCKSLFSFLSKCLFRAWDLFTTAGRQIVFLWH